jgi:hypothetical protein
MRDSKHVPLELLKKKALVEMGGQYENVSFKKTGISMVDSTQNMDYWRNL